MVMNENKYLLGSHVAMKAPEYLLGSVKEALSYHANAFMIYTGPPQNTLRKNLEELKIISAQELWKEKGKALDNIIVHAPYIINLASADADKRQFGVDFFIKEVERTAAIGAKYIVLHPGSAINTTPDLAIKNLIQSLNQVISNTKDVVICLETMAGKGNEIGKNFDQLQAIIAKITNKKRIGVCLDTCHVHDAGYDLAKTEQLFKEINKTIGLEQIKVIHFNDSLSEINSHKDRHANIGYGKIGFNVLLNLLNCKQFINLPVILETPYVDNQPPYAQEIIMLNNQTFHDPFPSKKS